MQYNTQSDQVVIAKSEDELRKAASALNKIVEMQGGNFWNKDKNDGSVWKKNTLRAKNDWKEKTQRISIRI